MTLVPSLILALAQAAQPQAAQPPAPPAQGSPTVVVTGRRPNESKIIRHMTAAVTPVGDATQPLPRFAAPICPEVGGLPEAFAKRFVDRMRDDARTGGLEVDREGCSPNITVLFVPNGQEVVKALYKTKPAMFGTLEPSRIRRLSADSGPVHVWSFTELRSRDKDQLRTGTTVAGKDAPELQVRDASIILSPTRIVVDGAIVLIDQPASIGKTINQLADYTVMRTLAQARPIGGDGGEPTVLRLFDRDEANPPPALTPFDAGYLKALYHGVPTELPFGKVAMMARAINKSLAASVVAADKSTAPAQ